MSIQNMPGTPLEERSKRPAELTHLYTFCRYLSALLVIFYGFAKLNGAQFTVLESELDRPMRDVSGFWLTWYYFGYSWYYSTLIALVQISGGVMLMFRKTTLLGALILAGVIGNIILINIFYGIDLGALMASLLIGGLLLTIISFHIPQLVQVYWTAQNPVYTERSPSWTVPLKIAVCSAIVLGAASGTYYIAHYNNRAPTSIDGRWELLQIRGGYVDLELPTHIYFERNRAHMAVLRYHDVWKRHHFDVDTLEQRLSIYEEWLARGRRIFDGEYRLEPPLLRIEGYFHDVPVNLDMIDMDSPEHALDRRVVHPE